MSLLSRAYFRPVFTPVLSIVLGTLSLTGLDLAPVQAEETMPRIISVSGYGTERVPTSLAAVQLGVEAQGETPLEVQQEVARRSSSIVDYLKSQSVSQLQTQSLSLSPLYDYSGNEPKITGYAASNIVSFRAETPRAGSLLDEAVKRGASRIDSMQFVATDEAITEARQAALVEATEDAQRQADAVLNALGLNRQSVLGIQINNAPSFPPTPNIMYAMESAKTSVTTPVVGGEQQVEAIVTIHFSY
jgi:uncharacterized protein